MTQKTSPPVANAGRISGKWLRRHTVRVAGALTGFVLTACQPGISYDQASHGPKIYLDQLSDAQKSAARARIVEALKRGLTVFDLGVGDEVAIYFHIDRRPTAKTYTIKADDKVTVNFLGDTANGGSYQVPPDGRIVMPIIGSVMAAGRTADDVAHEIEQRYSSILTEPKVTVNVSRTHTPLDDFIRVVSSSGTQRSIVEKVLPDGTISLPLLSPLPVAGATPAMVERQIDAAYAAKGLDVFVSLVPRSVQEKSTAVIGEVTHPGRYQLQRPTTALMAVALAGGVLTTGSMDAVRLYYVDPAGVPHVRSINLDNVIDQLALEDDMIVPDNSIIYVPPTDLALTGRFLDATLRDLLQFQGMGIGGALLLNQ